MKLVTVSSLSKRRFGILASGCFDLMHIGHIRYLQWAKCLSPWKHLVVAVTGNNFIDKGDGRPAFDQSIRAESVGSLECVDFVCIVEAPTALPAIEAAQPAIYAKGRDWIGRMNAEEVAAVEAHGGKVVFQPPEYPVWSSTEILTGEYLKRATR